MHLDTDLFQQFIGNIPGVVYQFCLMPDQTPVFTYISPGCQAMFERSDTDIYRDAHLLIQSIHADDQIGFQHRVAASEPGPSEWSWVGRIVVPSGQLKWIKGHAYAQRLPDRTIIWNGLLTEINQQQASVQTFKQTQAVLERRIEEDRTLALASANVNLLAEIEDRQRVEAQLRRSEQNLKAIFNGVYDALIVHTVEGDIIEVNEQMLELFCVSRSHATQFSLIHDYSSPEQDCSDLPLVWAEVIAGKNQFLEWKARRPLDGSTFDAEIYLRRLIWEDQPVILANVRDVTLRRAAEEALRQSEVQAWEKSQQLEQTLNDLRQAQFQLIQSEKMSSLGQLVAGVAHEINNPVNFIYGNLTYATQYTRDVLRLLQCFQDEYPSPTPRMQQEMDSIDLEFLMDDLPKLLASMKVGAERIREIVRSLRNFSRVDEAEVKPVNLHEGLDSTLMILQNRLKAKLNQPALTVVKHYSPLPPVECYAGQLNQVFMNILTNAIDALEERDLRRSPADLQANPSTITLTTELDGSGAPIPFAIVRIADNGPGIPLGVQQSLFDPFFTTKPVGKGTGLGMSISQQIVVEKHKGKLICNSEPGQGAEFVIAIPIRQTRQRVVSDDAYRSYISSLNDAKSSE